MKLVLALELELGLEMEMETQEMMHMQSSDGVWSAIHGLNERKIRSK